MVESNGCVPRGVLRFPENSICYCVVRRDFGAATLRCEIVSHEQRILRIKRQGLEDFPVIRLGWFFRRQDSLTRERFHARVGASTRDIRTFYYRSYALRKGSLFLTLFAGTSDGGGGQACIESDSC